MPEIITAIYENGVLRPLKPLPLQEHQTVQIQVLLDEDSRAELEQIGQFLVATGLLTPPPHRDDVQPVSEAVWGELIEKLKATPAHDCSECRVAN